MCPKDGRTKGLEIKRTYLSGKEKRERDREAGREVGRKAGREGGREGANGMKGPWGNQPVMRIPGFIPRTAGIHPTPQQGTAAGGAGAP